jgi:hypothetical protein
MNSLTLEHAAFIIAVLCLALLAGIRLLEGQTVRSRVLALWAAIRGEGAELAAGLDEENAGAELADAGGPGVGGRAVLLCNLVGRRSEAGPAVNGNYGAGSGACCTQPFKNIARTRCLGRIPTKWNHFIEKDSRQIDILEQILIAKVFNFGGICSSALPGEVESPRRKGNAPNQYLGANPYRQSLQLWRDLL